MGRPDSLFAAVISPHSSPAPLLLIPCFGRGGLWPLRFAESPIPGVRWAPSESTARTRGGAACPDEVGVHFLTSSRILNPESRFPFYPPPSPYFLTPSTQHLTGVHSQLPGIPKWKSGVILLQNEARHELRHLLGVPIMRRMGLGGP
jgi:hypothetical protein